MFFNFICLGTLTNMNNLQVNNNHLTYLPNGIGRYSLFVCILFGVIWN